MTALIARAIFYGFFDHLDFGDCADPGLSAFSEVGLREACDDNFVCRLWVGRLAKCHGYVEAGESGAWDSWGYVGVHEVLQKDDQDGRVEIPTAGIPIWR